MGAITGQMANIDPASGATSMMFHATPHVMDFDPHSGDYVCTREPGSPKSQTSTRHPTRISCHTSSPPLTSHAAPHAVQGLGFFGNALESGAYYVVDDTLGPLCYLCDVSLHSTTDAPRAPNPHPNSSLADHVTITPRDAYRIAAYIEPLGLYITAQCGTLRSLTLGSAATLAPHEQPPAPAASSGAISISFDADAPCSRLRLKLTKTAKSRPGSGFEVVGGSMVRGAWEVPPASGAEPTVVQVTYAE